MFKSIISSARRLSASLAAGLALAALTGVVPAHAEWLKAESERFVVYSEGSESNLRRFVQHLDTYDRLLSLSLTGSMGEAPLRKLPIYLVGSRGGLVTVRPDLGDNIVGYYLTDDEDIFAMAIRDGDDDTLLHEYAHHFMFQNAAYPYPGWFVEGFAEYYATAEFKSDRVLVGQYSENRAGWLQTGTWLDMRTLLSNRPGGRARGSETYYPLAWLLTHWFWGNPERQVQLKAYLLDVGAGTDPVEAMQKATGLDPAGLRRALRRYMSGGIPYKAVVMDFPEAPTTVTHLPRSADTLLLLGQRLKVMDREDDDAARVLATVRTQAARFPDDGLATLVLARAEMKLGDLATGQTLALKLLEREPANVEALQLLATAEIRTAGESDDVDVGDRAMGQARAYLGRAYRADEGNFRTYMLLTDARRGMPGYPNDNDMATLRFAHTLAPQLPDTVLQLAHALIYKNETEEALSLLKPLANNPHGGGAASAAQSMINQIKGVSDAEEQAKEDAPAEPEDGDAAGGDGSGA
jgi:tetratricopeptide (TPR) repeat protein